MENNKALKHHPSATVLSKYSTYIPGLDDILSGGFPRGRTTVIKGGAGSGKTLMSLETLFRGALDGEPGIFVGFEESAEQVRENAATLGWDLSKLERENLLFLLEGQVCSDMVLSGDFSLKGLLATASGKSREMDAKHIVVDALDVVFHLFDTPRQVRNEMHVLNDWLHDSGLSVILTVRLPSPGRTSAYEDFFESLADCVITMNTRLVDQVSIRRLQTVKYRGSGFSRNEYPYVITETGLHVAPISTLSLGHRPLGDKITSGNTRLDEILDGGYKRSACILVAGMPGTGKTILACTFVSARCDRGETVLYIGFEESQAALVGNVSNAGLAISPHIDSGQLVFLTSFPEAMGAEEHYIRALDQITVLSPDHVVIDAVSACDRMGGKRAAFEYLMRLFNTCKEQGITLMMLNQLGTNAFLEISGNGISSMVDTVVFLDYHKGFGETNRLIQVLKARGSSHSNQKREYVITDHGVELLDVYLGKGEVLTGMARVQQDVLEESEAQLFDYEIQALELELRKKKLARKLMDFNLKERSADREGGRADKEGNFQAGSGFHPTGRRGNP